MYVCVCRLSWPEKETSVFWEIPGCQHFILFALEWNINISEFLSQGDSLCGSLDSWAVLGWSLGTQWQGHQASRQGQRAASWPGCPGSFQRKFNGISMLLLTGKQLCNFKADRYHGVFSLHFNLKFCFKQEESNILSFSVDWPQGKVQISEAQKMHWLWSRRSCTPPQKK